jgi:hypothetical protein
MVRAAMAHPRPAAPSQPVPLQAHAHITVDAVIAATAQILLKEGYGAGTTNRVARVVGVSIGSLYQYFSRQGGAHHRCHGAAPDEDRSYQEVAILLPSGISCQASERVRPVAPRDAVAVLVEPTMQRDQAALPNGLGVRERPPRGCRSRLEPRITREFGGSSRRPERGARSRARDYSGFFPPLFAEGKSGFDTLHSAK